MGAVNRRVCMHLRTFLISCIITPNNPLQYCNDFREHICNYNYRRHNSIAQISHANSQTTHQNNKDRYRELGTFRTFQTAISNEFRDAKKTQRRVAWAYIVRLWCMCRRGRKGSAAGGQCHGLGRAAGADGAAPPRSRGWGGGAVGDSPWLCGVGGRRTRPLSAANRLQLSAIRAADA